MKKWISLVLTTVLTFSLSMGVMAASYGNDDNDDTPPNVPSIGTGASQSSPTSTVSNTAISKSISSAAKNPGSPATVHITNNAIASAKVMDTIAKSNVPVTFEASNYTITIDPKTITTTQNINLAASSSSLGAQKTFEKFFDNNIATISLGQKGYYGATLQLTIQPAALKNLDLTKPLMVYSYNSKTNTFLPLPAGSCIVGPMGNLIIQTPRGYELVITDAPLKLK